MSSGQPPPPNRIILARRFALVSFPASLSLSPGDSNDCAALLGCVELNTQRRSEHASDAGFLTLAARATASCLLTFLSSFAAEGPGRALIAFYL